MPSISLRPFAATDLAPVVALWNRCLPADPISEDRFWRLMLLDPNFDPTGTLVAIDDATSSPVGYLQTIYRRYPLGSVGLEPDRGWLTVFFVAPEGRRQGIGSRLLDAGLTHLRDAGRTRVSCNGYAPYYLFPGVDEEYTAAHAFLLARGFAPGADAVAMELALVGVEMPDAVRERVDAFSGEGITVRLFHRADTLPILRFVEAHFPHWTPSLLDGLRAGNETIVVAADATGTIVAYTQWQNPHNDPPAGLPGRFGPFGVHPDLRGRGVGAVVFYRLVELVRVQGARHLWFGWAGGRNVAFYERLGCQITRRYRLYGRAL